MTYRFKPLPELYWGVVIAASLVLLQALLTLDPEKVADWRTWAVALGGAAIRAGAGSALDYLRRSMAPEPTLAAEPVPAVPIAVMHRRCKGAAFLSLVVPSSGSLMRSDEAIHVNGRPMTSGEPFRCDSCAMPIGAPVLDDGIWVAETAAPPAPRMPSSSRLD